MFFRAAQKNAIEEESSPAVYAVGTGQIAAIRRLNRRRQYAAMSLARTLLHVHEAMLAARNSERKGVGRAKYYVVLKKRESSRSTWMPTLQRWRVSERRIEAERLRPHLMIRPSPRRIFICNCIIGHE